MCIHQHRPHCKGELGLRTPATGCSSLTQCAASVAADRLINYFAGGRFMPAAGQPLDRVPAAALLPANCPAPSALLCWPTDQSLRWRLLPACCHVVPAERTILAHSMLTGLQVFDVASFDMIAMLRLPWVPGCVEWCFRWVHNATAQGAQCNSLQAGPALCKLQAGPAFCNLPAGACTLQPASRFGTPAGLWCWPHGPARLLAAWSVLLMLHVGGTNCSNLLFQFTLELPCNAKWHACLLWRSCTSGAGPHPTCCKPPKACWQPVTDSPPNGHLPPAARRRGDAKAKLAISDSGSGAVHLYDMRRCVPTRLLCFLKELHTLRD